MCLDLSPSTFSKKKKKVAKLSYKLPKSSEKLTLAALLALRPSLVFIDLTCWEAASWTGVLVNPLEDVLWCFVPPFLRRFVLLCEVWTHFASFCRVMPCFMSFCGSLQRCQWVLSPCSCWRSSPSRLAQTVRWHQLIKYLWLLIHRLHLLLLVITLIYCL